jgi:hypothetical protein
MAITINRFAVSNNRQTIALDITVGVGETVTDVKLWTDRTYKNAGLAVDCNSLLAGTSNIETIVIGNEQTGDSFQDGIYFVQITSSDSSDIPGIAATVSLTRYYGVTAQLLANVDLSCMNCNENFQNATLLDLYVQGMSNALKLGRFRDGILFHQKINIFTEASCAECSDIAPAVSSAGNIVSVGVVDCILDL